LNSVLIYPGALINAYTVTGSTKILEKEAKMREVPFWIGIALMAIGATIVILSLSGITLW